MNEMSEMVFCQSCGMPLQQLQDHGTNADGSQNGDYCQYCYQGGAFVKEETMEEMIESCIPFCLNGNPYHSEEEARAAMREYFPKLKRWAR